MTMRHNTFLKYLLLFFLGGFLYGAVENLSRGFSHISMFLAGGLCFLGIGSINEFFSEEISLVSQMLFSSLIITAIELVTGLIVNVWLGLGVWDYSAQPFNYLGQICLIYSVCWFFLSLPAIFLDDWIRHHVFGERRHHYKIF